ncbi:Z1 domain-containing protein [Thalassospira sp. HF15]|uniref:Z1 domain-containing protein n=1 Tax=Thalassospira sp. HF15 TaxID=2722755 RepID=UPI001430AA32|nr:Z1 domain-containing protein [Thalassospira sp. HF15]NIY74877.1 Z1 domain-containing protein [Thalassospira sp. HF15]
MYDKELAYFRIHIEAEFSDIFATGAGLPEGKIEEIVREGPFTHLGPDELASIARELKANFRVTQQRGAVISKGHRPWLSGKKSELNLYYWNRLRKYYRTTGKLPSKVVATLDSETDEILDLCGDPLDPSYQAVRGMVMGNVQMGKTTNYSALICKAADAGYRVIILLAGITNSLRTQTQERLDETFIGRVSLRNEAAQQSLPIQKYAAERRVPSFATTRDSDFKDSNEGIYFDLTSHAEPIIFVTKKNNAVLVSLNKWLGRQEDTGGFDLPLLLIDDEADNASINTANEPKNTTAINGHIRKILARFPRSAYVGYTATPFANIFIDPETSEKMENDDLFPGNFIKALEPPSNYIGSHRVFRDSGDLRSEMVRTVDDYDPLLKLNHKSGDTITDLPESLKHAIRVFCLTRAIQVFRRKGESSCSMMINVSRFNAIQEQILGHVHEYLSELKDAVSIYGALEPKKIRDTTIAQLQESFNKEYSNSGYSWTNILGCLNEGIQSIRVRTINMRGGTLDYSFNKEHGLHVIAIGGLALSRGLTLEGLTVSYLLRNVAASDTLMQMARWFGYRPDYEHICRLYLPKSSLEHYKYVDEATEELRREVVRMTASNRTPADFGLKVRQSDLAIRVTAANKMRTAQELTIAQDYSARHVEGHSLPNDSEKAAQNLSIVSEFLELLSPTKQLKMPEKGEIAHISWEANGKDVLDLIANFEFGPHIDLAKISNSSLLQDYIKDRISDEMSDWDVVLPMLRIGDEEVFVGETVRYRRRKQGTVSDGCYRIYGARSRVADPGDAWIGLDADQIKEAERRVGADEYKRERAACSVRQKPMLIVHYFAPSLAKRDSDEDKKHSDDKLRVGDRAVTLSFCMPETSKPAKEHTYQVNAVYLAQLKEQIQTEEDDDAEAIAGVQDV